MAGPDKARSKPAASLRQRAESASEARREIGGLSAEEVRRLVHELEIHQIELEMQNDELLRAQDELDKSRAHYRDLFDFAPVGYLMLNGDAVIVQANLKAAQLLGAERSVLTGQPFNRFIASESTDEFYRCWQGLTSGAALFACELSLRRKDRARVSVSVYLEGPVEESGDSSWRCALTDISDRKKTEEARRAYAEELQRKNEELKKLNSQLEEFAFAASHDLQEPLRTVKIFSELLLEHCRAGDDAEAVRFSDYIDGSVRKMQQLIRDLLEYSRAVHPEQEPSRATDLNQCLDEAISVLSVRIEEAGAMLVRCPLPTVLGDGPQMGMVFRNLLSNALKYRRADVPLRLEIGAEKRDGEWVVSVKDNGIGFHPSHAIRIFGLFKRLHTTAYPGTGVGLAISKRIIERYHGRIWAQSEGDGQGATFSFSLPEMKKP
ncbi:MAG TPA: ATP-binding protein [Bryobacteraceae bacterium]|nr:ATP-binding protein [Bryobacteraceae bacterium]